MKDNMFKVDPTGRVGDSAFAEIDTMRSGHGWGDKRVAGHNTPDKNTTEKKGVEACAKVPSHAPTKASAKKNTSCKAGPAYAAKGKPAGSGKPDGEGLVVVEEVIVVDNY